MLSIIILTYNSEEFIEACLDSVFRQCYQGFEVIVIDNGSSDNTVGLIEKEYNRVSLIRNKENYGASVARNQGIKVSAGKWILTLDCDVTIEDGFLSEIVDIINNVSFDVGMLQPKILRIDKKTIYTVGIYVSLCRRFYDIGKDKIDNGQFNFPAFIFGASSATAIYRRSMLEDIEDNNGYFDENLFFLFEDVDLSWRAQKKGWKALFCPHLICYHSGNSSKTNNKLRQFFCFRNRYLLIQKNDPLIKKIRLFFLNSWYESIRLFYLLFTNKYIRNYLLSLVLAVFAKP